MNKHDLAKLIGDPKSGDPVLLDQVSGRLADNEPELQSLLWMLREGVIGRSHFQSLLSSAMQD